MVNNKDPETGRARLPTYMSGFFGVCFHVLLLLTPGGSMLSSLSLIRPTYWILLSLQMDVYFLVDSHRRIIINNHDDKKIPSCGKMIVMNVVISENPC